MDWYVVKRLHVPKGTIKFLERQSIKMTQTMHFALEQYWAGLFSRTKIGSCLGSMFSSAC